MNTHKSKNIKLLLAGAIIAGTLVLTVFLGNKTTSPFEYTFDWPRGKAYVYRLSYANTNETNIFLSPDNAAAAKQSFNAVTELRSELVLKSYGKQDDSYVLGVSLQKISKGRLEVMGAPIAKDERTLRGLMEGPEGFLEVTPLGEITRLHFDKNAPEVFKNILQSLSEELTVIVKHGPDKWTVTETSRTGTAPNHYALTERTSNTVNINKTRDGYDTLNAVSGNHNDGAFSGQYKVSLSPKGHVDSIRGTETIRVLDKGDVPLLSTDTEFSLQLKTISDFTPEQTPKEVVRDTDARMPGQIVVSAVAQNRALSKRAAGLTTEKLLTDLDVHGDSGKMPFHSRWVWQATGRLRLEPQACWKLVPMLKDPQKSVAAKTFMLELLVSVGHEEAQAVLRTVLGDDGLTGDPEYYDMLQRLALLEQPSPKTGGFLLQTYARTQNDPSSRDTHFAAAYSLGGMARKLRENGHEKEADDCNGALLESLQRAHGSTERETYLRGLGNASVATNVDAISAFAKDEEPSVRRAVAVALRNTQTPKAEETVMKLMGDQSFLVQKDALGVMDKYEHRLEHFGRLKTLLDDDALNAFNYGNAALMATREVQSGGQGAELSRQMLEGLLEKEISPTLRSQIRATLENGA